MTKGCKLSIAHKSTSDVTFTKRCKRNLYLKMDVNIRVSLVMTKAARKLKCIENGCTCNYCVCGKAHWQTEYAFHDRTDVLDTSNDLE